MGIAATGAFAGGLSGGIVRGQDLAQRKRYMDQQELMQQYLPRIMSGDDNWQDDYARDYEKKFGRAPVLNFGKAAGPATAGRANPATSMAAKDTGWEPGGNTPSVANANSANPQAPHTAVGLSNIPSEY